jgi:type IV pilus assembly protein PilB
MGMTQFDDTATNARISALHKAEEERLVQTLAPKYGYQYANLADISIDIGALKLVPEETARRAEVAVFERGNESVSLAVHNPKHPEVSDVIDSLRKQGLEPQIFLVSGKSIDRALARYKEMERHTAEERGVLDTNPDAIKQFMDEVQSYLDVGGRVAEIQEGESLTKTSDIISTLFGGALALLSSDIHIEQEAQAVRVRFRIDGVLFDVCTLDRALAKKILSRLKLLSGLKLNIKKEAQDGRFTIDLGGREVEVRSSVIPGGYGESIVMRLLDPSAATFKLDNLGINARLYEVITQELQRPNGAIITTGPTGSGKTTALYSFLVAIHKPGIKILTLENPIEYKLPGIVQTQVTKGFSFAQGLRAMLRQDPDVILVGEIRDREVAETATQAALTGHLVFSTLHTNNAAGSFARLINLGVSPKTIGSAYNIMLGQRLVRVLCPHCKVERDVTTAEQKVIQSTLEQPVSIHTVFDAKGCDECGGSGYKGRIGVFEAIIVDEQVEEAVISDARESVILEAAKHQNIPTMEQDGIMKALAGTTSFDELTRVLDISLPE